MWGVQRRARSWWKWTDGGLAVSRARRGGVAGIAQGRDCGTGKAVAAVQKAVEAARMWRGAVEHAIVGIGGAHVRGVNSHGGISLGNRRPHEIGRDEIKQAVERARAIPLPDGREVLHLLPQEFILDDQAGVHDPLGMMAARLEVRVHLVTAARVRPERDLTAVNRGRRACG